MNLNYPWKQFENLGRPIMSRFFGVQLDPVAIHGFPKRFDMVSPCLGFTGDFKYLSLVNGTGFPPAKIAEITSHVWLLEQTAAGRRFLVFGNQREVPEIWIKKYGKLKFTVEFYFIDANGTIDRLI